MCIRDRPFDELRLLAGNLMPPHAVLFRHDVIDLGCRFDESIDLFEDWDFWQQIARHSTFAHVLGVSAYYRIHASSGAVSYTHLDVYKRQEHYSLIIWQRVDHVALFQISIIEHGVELKRF